MGWGIGLDAAGGVEVGEKVWLSMMSGGRVSGRISCGEWLWEWCQCGGVGGVWVESDFKIKRTRKGTPFCCLPVEKVGFNPELKQIEGLLGSWVCGTMQCLEKNADNLVAIMAAYVGE